MSKIVSLVHAYCVVNKGADGKLVCKASDKDEAMLLIGLSAAIGELVFFKEGFGQSLEGATKVVAKAVKEECINREIDPKSVHGLEDFLPKEAEKVTP
ncbi:MAG: hypothetical protein HQ539_01655 [Parcubacteria group bacterium]|nr:hypothetical protein [Parcubacteria group bacterium]